MSGLSGSTRNLALEAGGGGLGRCFQLPARAFARQRTKPEQGRGQTWLGASNLGFRRAGGTKCRRNPGFERTILVQRAYVPQLRAGDKRPPHTLLVGGPCGLCPRSLARLVLHGPMPCERRHGVVGAALAALRALHRLALCRGRLPQCRLPELWTEANNGQPGMVSLWKTRRPTSALTPEHATCSVGKAHIFGVER